MTQSSSLLPTSSFVALLMVYRCPTSFCSSPLAFSQILIIREAELQSAHQYGRWCDLGCTLLSIKVHHSLC